MPFPQHPHYDEVGVMYDGGFFYSDGLPDVPPTPTPRRKKAMASLALNLNRLNRDQRLSLAQLGVSTMAPAAPATPPIAGIATEVAAMGTAATAAAAKKAAWESLKAHAAAAKAEMDAAFDTLDDEVRAVVSVVEAKAKGDPTILTKSGWPLAGERAPSQVPSQLTNFSVSASDMEGALDVSWDPEINSVDYQVEVTTSQNPLPGDWVRKPSVTASSTTITGLTSGQRAWARARGHGPKGEGPWSDPGTKIVP
jgi:hypothetical protein